MLTLTKLSASPLLFYVRRLDIVQSSWTWSDSLRGAETESPPKYSLWYVNTGSALGGKWQLVRVGAGSSFAPFPSFPKLETTFHSFDVIARRRRVFKRKIFSVYRDNKPLRCFLTEILLTKTFFLLRFRPL